MKILLPFFALLALACNDKPDPVGPPDDQDPPVAAGKMSAVTDAFTVELREVPPYHTGGDFSFRIVFSEGFAVSYRTIRDHLFTVEGGFVRRAHREGSIKNKQWQIVVETNGSVDVTLSFDPPDHCGAQSICSNDDVQLSDLPADFTVPYQLSSQTQVSNANPYNEYPVHIGCGHYDDGGGENQDLTDSDGWPDAYILSYHTDKAQHIPAYNAECDANWPTNYLPAGCRYDQDAQFNMDLHWGSKVHRNRLTINNGNPLPDGLSQTVTYRRARPGSEYRPDVTSGHEDYDHVVERRAYYQAQYVACNEAAGNTDPANYDNPCTTTSEVDYSSFSVSWEVEEDVYNSSCTDFGVRVSCGNAACRDNYEVSNSHPGDGTMWDFRLKRYQHDDKYYFGGVIENPEGDTGFKFKEGGSYIVSVYQKGG